MSLRSYLLSRTLLTLPMVIVLLSLVFLVLRVLPGDPVTILEGKDIRPEALARRRHELGLDQPLLIQYLNYLGMVLRGDLGVTALQKVPVAYLIGQRLPATIELAVGSLLIAVILGLLLGAHGAFRGRGVFSYAARIYGMVIFSIPVFFLGLTFIAFFAVALGLFPTALRLSPAAEIELLDHRVTGFVFIDSILAGKPHILLDGLHHIILPSLVLGLYLSGIFVRLTYSQVSETLTQDYVTAARARGLRESTVLYRYGLRNALIPLVTMMGLQFAALLGGAVLTETIFSWPGIGLLVYEGILARDYNIVQGSIVVYALLVALVSLVVDVVYAFLDPRIRY